MSFQDLAVALCVLGALCFVWRRWRPAPRARVTVVPLASVRRRRAPPARSDDAS